MDLKAIYRPAEGTPNLKTAFKLDLIFPPPAGEMQKHYRIVRDGAEEILSPREVFEHFVAQVSRTPLETVGRKDRRTSMLDVKRLGVIIGVPPIKDDNRRQAFVCPTSLDAC